MSFSSAESPLQVPSEPAQKSGHSKHAFSREFAENKKKKKEEGPSLMTLMTKPFVYKNFSQMTQEFTVHVFGSDHCTIQIGIYVYVTQSFNSCFRDFL